ncbi:MAG: hypothetical protein H0W63_01505 [Gemmatimonadaceae bacterium]|nr:hypothetical protein [Gemmatimonadaceae bacterium]
MKAAAIAFSAMLAFAAPLAAQSADSSQSARAAHTHDSLFGLDKPKHFVLSAFIEGASFAGLEAAGARRQTAMIGAVSVTSLFAVAREIHDRRTKGLFSFGDLVWDALGAGAGAILVRNTYR